MSIDLEISQSQTTDLFKALRGRETRTYTTKHKSFKKSDKLIPPQQDDIEDSKKYTEKTPVKRPLKQDKIKVHSSFAIILIGKGVLVALHSLSSWCLVIAVVLFLAVPWVCLQFAIVVFTDHTHLLFLITNGRLLKVKSDAECSPWSILQYF